MWTRYKTLRDHLVVQINVLNIPTNCAPPKGTKTTSLDIPKAKKVINESDRKTLSGVFQT